MLKRSLADRLFWDYLTRWRDVSPETDRIKFLKSVPLFKDLSIWQIRLFKDVFFERSYSAGELLFEKGQPGAALFVIEEGSVVIEHDNGSSITELATLSRGQFLGELALLDGSPRSASARAKIPVRTLALYRSDLVKLIDSQPELACRVYQSLARIIGDRLKATNELFHAQEKAA